MNKLIRKIIQIKTSSVKNERGRVIEVTRGRTELGWMIKGASEKLTFELSSEFPKTNPAKAWGRKEGLGLQEAAARAQERSGIEERCGWTARVVRVEVRQGQDKTFASYSKGNRDLKSRRGQRVSGHHGW